MSSPEQARIRPPDPDPDADHFGDPERFGPFAEPVPPAEVAQQIRDSLGIGARRVRYDGPDVRGLREAMGL